MSDYGLAMDAMRPSPSYEKDPSDTVDYALSWHQIGDDTISTSVWESDSLTIGVDTIVGKVTTCFVSGGTAGDLASLTNTITTGVGRTLQRTVYISVEEM